MSVIVSSSDVAVTVNETTQAVTVSGAVVSVEIATAGAQGPAGQGVPSGGTTGQILTKASGTDYDTAWQDATGGGSSNVFIQPVAPSGVTGAYLWIDTSGGDISFWVEDGV